MNPFPSADELAKLTQESKTPRDRLLEKLQAAAEQGLYECTINALLCPLELKAMLVSLGYCVEPDGRTVRISWKE
jgi:hypothetical protein